MIDMIPSDLLKKLSKVANTTDKFITAAMKRGEEAYSRLVSVPVPEVESKVDEDAFSVTLPLPGVPKEDISVASEGGTLTILVKGRPHQTKPLEEDAIRYHVDLPFGVMPIDTRAEYKDGLLSILMPMDKESSDKINIELE